MTIVEKLDAIREFETKITPVKDRLANVRLNCARWLLGQLEQEKIQPVNDHTAERIIRRFLKTSENSTILPEEIELMEKLLPERLTRDEMSIILEEHKDELLTAGGFGAAMARGNSILKGQNYNGADLSYLVKQTLQILQ